MIAGTTSYYSKLEVNNIKSKSMSIKEKQSHISELYKVSNVEKEYIPENNKGQKVCNFVENQKQISRILLGQQLLKNNGIFSPAVMIKLQAEDMCFLEVIKELECCRCRRVIFTKG